MRVLLVAILAAVIAVLALWPAPAPITHAYFKEAPAGRAEIIAHGGGQGVRPPDTLEALDAATEMGADALETDVQQTADGVLVLMHDDTLDRTTNLSGKISTLTLAQVRKADAGDNSENPGQSFAGKGVVVPTLQEALARHPRARWTVEIKPDTSAAAETLCRDIHATHAEARVLVASFHDKALGAFRRVCPEIATSMAQDETRNFVLAAYVGLSRFVPTPAAAMQIPVSQSGIDLASPRVIAAAHKRGIRVQYWTINDPAEMKRLLARGADGLITDYVATGRAALAEPGP